MSIGTCTINKLLGHRFSVGTEEENRARRSPLPAPVFRDGHYVTVTTSNGIVFSELRSNRIAQEAVIGVSDSGPSIKLSFQLQAERSYVGLANRDGWLEYPPGASHVLSPAVHRGKLKVEPGARLHQATLFLPPENAADMLDGEELPVCAPLRRMLVRPEACPPVISGSVTPRQWKVLQELQSCPFCGRLRECYVEAKLSELAVLRLYDELAPHPRAVLTATTVKLRRTDRCKIEEAAEIMCDRMQDPPTLHELSVLVGLNVNKLKYGFRWLYGTTVFRFLHGVRMREAYRLLEETELSVGEISEYIGYSRQSAFSVAFKREYGFSPRAMRRESG
jgi:AraC-like DNA-binding protein